MIKERIIGFVIALILRLLRMTFTYQEINREVSDNYHEKTGHPPIYAVLHAHQLTLVAYNYYPKFGVIVSKSKDGEIAATVLKHFGMIALRGSSSKGGKKALQAAVTHVLDSNTMAITVDGPRGPRGIVKRGICELARQTERAIIPVIATTKQAKKLKSWDRFEIPMPFAKIIVRYGDPIYIKKLSNEEQIFQYCSEVQQQLAEMEKVIAAIE